MLYLILMHKHNAVENTTEKGWNDFYWNHCVCFIPSDSKDQKTHSLLETHHIRLETILHL